jgi:hypothetical protein
MIPIPVSFLEILAREVTRGITEVSFVHETHPRNSHARRPGSPGFPAQRKQEE